MWCASCQTDVAGEVSADGQSVLCTACGGEVSTGRSLSLHPKTREARELLQRWSTEELLDPDVRLTNPAQHMRFDQPHLTSPEERSNEPSSAEASPGALESASSAASEAMADVPANQTSRTIRGPHSRPAIRRKYRVDDQHHTRIGSETPVPAPHRGRSLEPSTERHSRSTRLDQSHEQVPTPHFNIASAFESKSKPGQGESLWGQILAYSGVGLLTVGTVMVLWGYFGGPESYTPTGWLLASAGQMLLFLGVVTLVSGGMEQTTHEVSRRIEYLGDQLVRFEQAQQDLFRGPHFALREEAETRSRSQQTVEAERNDRTDR